MKVALPQRASRRKTVIERKEKHVLDPTSAPLLLYTELQKDTFLNGFQEIVLDSLFVSRLSLHHRQGEKHSLLGKNISFLFVLLSFVVVVVKISLMSYIVALYIYKCKKNSRNCSHF